MNITDEQWLKFAEKIIATNGNPTTKDAADCGIVYGTYFLMAMQNSRDQLLHKAHEVLGKENKNE